MGICGQNICYDVSAFVIPFNLICNMTMFWKSWILTCWPHPQGRGWGSAGKIYGTMLLHSWFSLMWYATWPCSENVEFRPIDSITRVRVSGGRGNCMQHIWYCVAAIVILLNLIGNMIVFWKSWILIYWPHSQGRRGGAACKIFGTVLLQSWFS